MQDGFDITLPRFWEQVGGRPNIDFFWKDFHGKGPRLVGNPNAPMRLLHDLFEDWIRGAIKEVAFQSSFGIRNMPSATGCVVGSNPTKNAKVHQKGKYFYITDLRHAYPSIDLDMLAQLLTFLRLYSLYEDEISTKFFAEDARKEMVKDHPLYLQVYTFLEVYLSGVRGKGLAIGGPLSPYLMNLYCEVFIDSRIRYLCDKQGIKYTRFVDDLVLSSTRPISSEFRREVRQRIYDAHCEVNHQKSHVLVLSPDNPVWVTKIGLAENEGSPIAKLVFPQKKRRRLHGAIGSYLSGQKDWPEMVSGLIGEFLYYFKNVDVKTATDLKTFALCKEFEAEWSKYGHKPGDWKKLKKLREKKEKLSFRARRK